MAIFQVPNIKIAGISACVPEKVFHNKNYDRISEKERETLIKTIGVKSKRHVNTGTTTSDLCYVSANKLIEDLKWERNEIDLLVFVSQSRDYIIPATAGLLQERLSLSKSCIAFDVSLGCSGYVYGLSIIGSMMATGMINKGLLLTGDISTLNTSYNDKSAFPLFGDAGSATAIVRDEKVPPMKFNLQTDGSGYDAIIIPDGGIRNFANKDTSFEYKEVSEGISRNNFNINLDGIKVFNFSLREVKPNVLKLLSEYNIDKDEIDYWIFHQANLLMNETIRKQLKLDPESVPYSLKEFGNTSSASIPLTIVTQLAEKVNNSKLNMAFSGFGVGLSWGTVVLEIDNIVCPRLLNHKD